MKKIILDTNFLLIPFTKNVDIFDELNKLLDEPFEVCILAETIDELKNIIKNQKGKYKDAAKLGLQLIKAKNISLLESKQKDLYMTGNSKDFVVDDIIVEIANESIFVATQDKLLKNRLNKKTKIIYLHNKKLEIKDVL